MQWMIRDFSRWGELTPKVGAPTYYFRLFFPDNNMKIKQECLSSLCRAIFKVEEVIVVNA